MSITEEIRDNGSKGTRTKYSALNAMSALILTLVNGSLGIVVTRLIIIYYGSDFNGLNSTVNQIINVLLILEGGFSLASNVALFDPIGQEDYLTSNRVLSATSRRFKKIGLLFFVLGVFVAVAYSFAVKTKLPGRFVFSVVFMGILPQAIDLYYVTVFRVLLRSQQKEYIINGFTAFTIGLGHLVNILVIIKGGSMWMIRFIVMLFALLNCFLISLYTKRKNSFIDTGVPAGSDLIKGTGDVMAQKITGVIYTSWPIVFLSISKNGGTVLASVYAVYNSVFVMIKALLHGIIDAPRLGFGQMLTEKKREEVWPSFKEYEYVAIFFTFVMMMTTCGLILPFVRIYTDGVNDAHYIDTVIAVLMVFIGAIEMLHIPSGHLINMSGNFRISKIFQIIACGMLVTLMAVLGSVYGIYGMLVSLLSVAILLAILEIGYIHGFFFEKKLSEFVVLSLPFWVVGIIGSFIEMSLTESVNNIISLLMFGITLIIVNSIVALAIGYVFNREETRRLFMRARSLITRH